MTQPAFVVGCPRSGTTLIQGMLAAHSAVYSPPETHFFSIAYRRNALMRAVTWPALNARIALERFLNELGRPDLARRYRVGLFDVRFARAFVGAMDELTREADKSVWVEKTPRHLHFIGPITQQIPEARFVHVVREGLAVARSLFRAADEYPGLWGGRRTPDDCVRRWNHDVQITRRFKDQTGHLVVRYEEAVNAPEQTARRMCEFLGVSYDAAMLQAETSFDRVVQDREAWKRNNQTPIATIASAELPWSSEVDDRVRGSLACLKDLGL